MSKHSWSYKRCLFCSGKIPYLPHWKNIPDKCNDCIFSEILNLETLFKRFLSKESSLRTKYMSAKDRTAYQNRDPLRKKVFEILSSQSKNKDIYEECKKDQELFKLAISLHKGQTKPKTNQTRAIPSHIAPFVSGGAPGLGKRS